MVLTIKMSLGVEEATLLLSVRKSSAPLDGAAMLTVQLRSHKSFRAQSSLLLITSEGPCLEYVETLANVWIVRLYCCPLAGPKFTGVTIYESFSLGFITVHLGRKGYLTSFNLPLPSYTSLCRMTRDASWWQDFNFPAPRRGPHT
jgi:hypothetical protein